MNRDDPVRRFLIATAVAHYAKAPRWDRPGLVHARERIIELFTGTLGYTHVDDLGLDPTREQLTEQAPRLLPRPRPAAGRRARGVRRGAR